METYVIYGFMYAQDNPLLYEDFWIEGMVDTEAEAEELSRALRAYDEGVMYGWSGPHFRPGEGDLA